MSTPITILFRSTPRIILVTFLCLAFTGCAIYHRDPDSGAEHIWGFGHLAMKVTPPLEGKQSIVRRATLTGIAISTGQDSFGISIGYDRKEHILIYDENTAISIQRPPSNDFFYFKIGIAPPEAFSKSKKNDTRKERENEP